MKLNLPDYLKALYLFLAMMTIKAFYPKNVFA
jgi:hypothetical protein